MSSTPPASSFSWLSATPEVTGYAHIGSDGSVLEWSGETEHEASHGALIFLLRLAGLCGEDLGLGPVIEAQTLGREGSAQAVNLGGGSVLTVLASPRANLRAISAQALGPKA